MEHPRVSLVILHGWGHTSQAWKNVADRLRSYNPVTFDLPGFGNEPLVSNTWGVPEYAVWVEKKITNMGLTSVILLGHSFGGRIAAHIASRRPKWLAGLILYGAPLLYRPSFSIRAQSKLAKYMKHIVPNDIKYLYNPELAKAEAEGLGVIFRRVVLFDQTNALSRINIPTLLLQGERDRAVPVELAYEAQERIPGSELIILPELGHNAHLENPSLFSGILSKFLAHYEHDSPLH